MMNRRCESFIYRISSISKLGTVGTGKPKLETLGVIVKNYSIDKI